MEMDEEQVVMRGVMEGGDGGVQIQIPDPEQTTDNAQTDSPVTERVGRESVQCRLPQQAVSGNNNVCWCPGDFASKIINQKVLLLTERLSVYGVLEAASAQ